MEEKQNTSSVIARLMGLDKQSVKQTPHNSSCIAALGKRSLYVDWFNRPNAKKHEKNLNNNEVSCTDRRNIWSIFDEKESPKEGRIEFNFSRKRYLYAKSSSENEMLSRSSGLVKGKDQSRNPESYCLSACRGDVYKKLKKITLDSTTIRSLKFENHGSLRSWSISRTKMKQSFSDTSKCSMNSPASTYDCTKVHQISHNIPSMEPEKKNCEPRLGKNVEDGEGYDAGARIKRVYPRPGKLKRLVGPSSIKRKNGLKNKLRPNLSVIASRSHNFKAIPDDPKTGSSLVLEQDEIGTHSFEMQLYTSLHLECSDNPQINALDHKETATSYEDGSSEIAPGTAMEKDGSSDVHGYLISKVSSCESNRGWVSRCQYDPNLSVISGDANQPTPDSVLEPPFKEDVSSISDLRGLAMRLQLLDSISEETNSVCSEMASSCEDFQNSGNIWEMIKPEESRDFSYLVDVLDEADISDENLCQFWHANELAIMDISVFELLEKKYGKQTSWQKSDRRLMFDRVNSLLSVILHSFSYFNMEAVPLKRRFKPGLRRAEIEDELWSLLVVQGKEADEKSLTKDMKWLDLEEDITSICTEIEQLLFRELVAELVSECS